MTDKNPPPNSGRITDLLIEREMRESYLNYSMSVILSRALPDVRDGLKPSQRRVLKAMDDLGVERAVNLSGGFGVQLRRH